ILTGKSKGQHLYAYPDGKVLGKVSDERLSKAIEDFLPEIFSNHQCTRTSFEVEAEEVEVFFDVLAPSPKLLVVGAVHIAIPLVEYAKILGFHTTVIDPRSAFSN